MKILSIALSVPEHSALSFLCSSQNPKITLRTIINIIIQEHLETKEIIQNDNTLTNEKRTYKIAVPIAAVRVAKLQKKLNKSDIGTIENYITQLVSRYRLRYVKTLELQDENGETTNREIK